MSDLSISQKFNMPITTPQFRSSNTNSISSTNKENKGLSTGAKVAIGTGLVALASYGIYVATRGKVKPKTTPPVTPNNPVQEIKELAVSAFKEAGNKFVKGKAVLADGTNYTGKIVSDGKDGSKVVMEYLDGVLQKSTKTEGTKTIFEKIYKYSDELGLEQVITNNNTTLEKFIDKAGNLNIRIPKKHHITIDKPSGLISIDGRFIDKQKNILGEFKDPYLIFPINSYVQNPIYKIRGAELPNCKMRSNPATDLMNNDIITWGYTGSQPKSAKKIEITERYSFDKDGNGKRIYIDFEMKYGKYKSLDIVFDEMKDGKYKSLYTVLKSGLVRNGDSPLFKYNYRTNEITDLKIDKKEAEELVNFFKEQYKFYQKAKNARLREYAAGTW